MNAQTDTTNSLFGLPAEANEHSKTAEEVVADLREQMTAAFEQIAKARAQAEANAKDTPMLAEVMRETAEAARAKSKASSEKVDVQVAHPDNSARDTMEIEKDSRRVQKMSGSIARISPLHRAPLEFITPDGANYFLPPRFSARTCKRKFLS